MTGRSKSTFAAKDQVAYDYDQNEDFPRMTNDRIFDDQNELLPPRIALLSTEMNF